MTALPVLSTSPNGPSQQYIGGANLLPTSSVPSGNSFGSLFLNTGLGILNTASQAAQNAASIVAGGFVNNLAFKNGFEPQIDTSPIAETEFQAVRQQPVKEGISTENKVLIGGGVLGAVLLVALVLKK